MVELVPVRPCLHSVKTAYFLLSRIFISEQTWHFYLDFTVPIVTKDLTQICDIAR